MIASSWISIAAPRCQIVHLFKTTAKLVANTHSIRYDPLLRAEMTGIDAIAGVVICPNNNEAWIYANASSDDTSKWVVEHVLKAVSRFDSV